MGFTFSLKMVGTKILVPGSWYQDLGTKNLVPGSWYQDLWGNRSLHDGGTALSKARNRYPFFTARTPQASLVGEKSSQFGPEKYEIWSEMGPYGSIGAHIKTGRSPMAQEHFQTPPDPQKGP